MNTTLSNAVQLLGRILLAYVFYRTSLANFGDHDRFVASIAKNGFPLPEITYWVAEATMFFGAICTVLGFQARIAALLLAVYCVWTAVQVHYVPGDVGQMTNFVKNLAMAGGHLQLLALGAGGWSLDAMIGRRR